MCVELYLYWCPDVQRQSPEFTTTVLCIADQHTWYFRSQVLKSKPFWQPANPSLVVLIQSLVGQLQIPVAVQVVPEKVLKHVNNQNVSESIKTKAISKTLSLNWSQHLSVAVGQLFPRAVHLCFRGSCTENHGAFDRPRCLHPGHPSSDFTRFNAFFTGLAWLKFFQSNLCTAPGPPISIANCMWFKENKQTGWSWTASAAEGAHHSTVVTPAAVYALYSCRNVDCWCFQVPRQHNANKMCLQNFVSPQHFSSTRSSLCPGLLQSWCVSICSFEFMMNITPFPQKKRRPWVEVWAAPDGEAPVCQPRQMGSFCRDLSYESSHFGGNWPMNTFWGAIPFPLMVIFQVSQMVDSCWFVPILGGKKLKVHRIEPWTNQSVL